MLCPTCNNKLLESIAHGINVDKCVSCGTFWFDAGELDTYISANFPEKTNVPSILTRFESSECSYEEFCPKCQKQKLICGRVGKLSLSKCAKCSGILITKDEIDSLKSSAGHPLAERLIVELIDGVIFTILNKL
jgi:Zn-finger nucleic acid-binding protein